jgi:hypothetical protein
MADVTHLAGDLWIGSAPRSMRGRERFDVIFLCAEEWQPPAENFPGAVVRRCGFDDSGDLTDEEIDVALNAAAQAAEDLVAGRTVLLTCAMGRNRSALVSALALHMVTGESAMRTGRLVREKRVDPTGVHALARETFWDVLRSVDAATRY